MADPDLSDMEPGWRWEGDPLPEKSDDNGRRQYKVAVKTFRDKTQPPLRVKVGDVILMKVYGDPECWVAHCIELCELGPDEECQSPSDEDDSSDEFLRMRVAVRWLYRPTDFNEENDGSLKPDPPLAKNELLWTDAIADCMVNGVDVIDGVAMLKHRASECVGVENAYFCRRFFYTLGDEFIKPPEKIPQHLVGQRLRDVGRYELFIWTSKGQHMFSRQNFWEERKQKVPRKSLDKKRKRKSVVDGSAQLVREEEPADASNVVTPKTSSHSTLADLSLESLLPSDQMDVLREKVRTLTVGQKTAIGTFMPTLSPQVTADLAVGAQKEKGAVITNHVEYEEVRDSTVKDVCRHFWQKVGEQP